MLLWMKKYRKKVLAVCICLSVIPILLSYLHRNGLEQTTVNKFEADYEADEISYGEKNQTKVNPKNVNVRVILKSDDVTVKIIDRLCVVNAKSPPYYVRNNVKGTTCKVPRKQLVVYDTRAKVYSSPYMPDVRFLPDPQPLSFTMRNTVAVISTARYLNNMNHFWREFMFPMARVLWNSVIPEGVKPLLLFIRPPINHCSNGTFPPSLLVWLDTFVRPILNVEMIEEPFDWRMYHSLPHGTCFKTSILINPIKYYTHSVTTRMRGELMKMFNITVNSCAQDRLVTFISRKGDREIVNELELQKAANEAGYDMKLVAMETLSLREQALQITCSKVLVGVQGAGLTWAIMLQNGASLIEIAWPSLGWPFRYSTDEMTELWPRAKTFQIRPSKLFHPHDQYGLLKKYSSYMVTKHRNLSAVAAELLETFTFKREEIVVDVVKLLSLVEKSKVQDGLGSLIEGLEFVYEKQKSCTVIELLRTAQRKVSPAAFRILVGITGAMSSMRNVAKKHQAYISPAQFLEVLKKATR